MNLSSKLEDKILKNTGIVDSSIPCKNEFPSLTVADEKELATEMLLYHHRFTELAFHPLLFKQASLTIIQNIYLFSKQKDIFCFFPKHSGDGKAGCSNSIQPTRIKHRIPLGKTFSHMVLAQIWNRILATSNKNEEDSFEFLELHNVVEKLNSLRNIYMILCHGFVHKLEKNISTIYRESITYEDAVQIGSFGIARAAYRYHQSHGFRFSTYAANWVFKEIQRQALKGRLIKISSNTVGRYAKAAREDNENGRRKVAEEIAARTALLAAENGFNTPAKFQVESNNCPATKLEAQQLQDVLILAIDQALTRKSGDVLKRRYGLPPYQGQKQSVIDIIFLYGVTRGSIYQLEQSAFIKLRSYLARTE